MTTFANDLSLKIRSNPKFWSDLENVWSRGFSSMFPSMQLNKNDSFDDFSDALSRQIQSASIFAKSSLDKDKALAQNMAVYASLATRESIPKQAALNILSELGNHPGYEKLDSILDLKPENFNNYLRNNLLRELNTVTFLDSDFALTDFQYRLLEELPKNQITAISAPTSAGKSFVILEHLSRCVSSEKNFNAVFIAPTRALLTEVFGKLTIRLENESANVRVSTIPTIDQKPNRNQVFVLTQERLQVLLSVWDGVFDLVVADEAQAIGDNSRGMILQDCLERLRSRSKNTNFLFLAPGATGFDSFTKILDVTNIEIKETNLSPVVQNRIVVTPCVEDENSLALSLLAENRDIDLGIHKSERGFANAKTRLSAVALELGRNGGSLVYGTGPADAEKKAAQIASGIEEEENKKLIELSEFIKKHIHKNYSLADHVLKGVGFHYGKMPSLLREALEDSFKKSDLNYLVCTTTLFQGVNLPARNVFIDTPTRGKGVPLDAASLWNFAGRAGRLGLDIVGNVFLVNYAEWEDEPLTERKSFSISPSFKKVLIEDFDEVIDRLSGIDNDENRFQPYKASDAAAGFLISKLVRNSLKDYIKRNLKGVLSDEQCESIYHQAEQTKGNLMLPDEALSNNWTVNPFGKARLLKRFREKIQEGKYIDLIPVNPNDKNSYGNYVAIYSRINKYILGKNPPKFSNMLAGTSLSWMKGAPLPKLIDNRIRFLKKQNNASRNIDSEVRNVFEFVEEILRFKYVQLGRTYIDLLSFALEEADEYKAANSIYDFPLALELGVSSVAGQAFIELGRALSR